MSVDVNNETEYQVDEKALVDLSRFVLDALRIHSHAELSVILVDAKAMEQLHLQWMDEPGPTDVLSFPMDELRPAEEGEEPAPGLLGDVVLCPEVAEKQAARAGRSTEEELHVLTVHGILHLLGYDHGDPEEERKMFSLQSRLFADWRAARGGRR